MKISKVREYFHRKKIYNITRIERGTLAIYLYHREVKVFKIFNDVISPIIYLLQKKNYYATDRYCASLSYYPKVRGYCFRKKYSRKIYYISPKFLLETLQNIQMLKKLD